MELQVILQYQKEVLGKGSTKPLNLIHGEEEYLVRTLADKTQGTPIGEASPCLGGRDLSREELFSFASDGRWPILLQGRAGRVRVISGSKSSW
ncbi:MAG: hypothetical protein Q9N34_06515 [Aquificota bacterium]|nr:hypothetical protein [Aquificota bacterium]